MSKCDPILTACMDDVKMLSLCTLEELEKLRSAAILQLREAMCSCQTAPIELGDVKFPSPAEMIRELRLLLDNVQTQIIRIIENEGPVVETIWRDRCNAMPGWSCEGPFYVYDSCSDD